ncbi:type II toxin-antitoxin system Phd/YefM family antitoxin [Granulicella sp. dw_53]|uniref:type II toxin-antitoxin system Phd/YefM family antitoxin n=1 Tax=Granulicella sp. dw_53 TaxID=2719792 RepID=UPI001BD1D8E8|nr:type II toxin-antitoxin system Phd/YefM family antitoxin [Granulicella sp. dw_53]
MANWGLAQAKANFSEVVAKAMTEGPQEITKSGKDAVVVVSKKEWDERARPKRSAADFWLNSPLRGSAIKPKGLRGGLRKVDL